jgi:hypothetical protein
MPARSLLFHLALSTVVLACADPGAESEQQGETGTADRLTIDGRRILDPDGHQIVLRGYNWGEWGTWRPHDGTDNASDGANVVRIPLRWWGDWYPGTDSFIADTPQTTCLVDGPHVDQGHLDDLTNAIQEATAAGLWVVLMVDSNYGQGADDRPDNFWTNTCMEQRFELLWTLLAKTYKSVPHIAAYEILAEPKPHGFTEDQVRDMYDRWIHVIRDKDANTPVIVGPTNDYDLSILDQAFTQTDDKVIYTGNYFIHDLEHADPTDRNHYIMDFLDGYAAPVWINQVGIKSGIDSDAEAVAGRLLDAFAKEAVGWTWWTYRERNASLQGYGVFYQTGDDDQGDWHERGDWREYLKTQLMAPFTNPLLLTSGR